MLKKTDTFLKTLLEKRTAAESLDEIIKYDELFDCCPCNSFDSGLARSKCSCVNKVPLIEWDFWVDQKSDRKMVISSIDKQATLRNLVRKKRKLDDKIRTESSSQCLKQEDLTLADLELDSHVDIPSKDDQILDEPDFEVPLKKASKIQHKLLSLPFTDVRSIFGG